MTGIAIKAQGLARWFGDADNRTYAVRDVSFEARFHEMLYIVGPSGSGKTTLLSIISGILRPNAGSVAIDGADVWGLRDNQIAELRLGKLGFVFQDYHLFPTLSTRENVAVPLILKRTPWREAMAIADKHLEIVGLTKRADLAPSRLSGGEQQRVAIARAIAAQPQLLILDEPTASLDGDTGRKIIEFVKTEVLSDHTCIVVVTHDDRIYSYADRILRMEDGRLTEPAGTAAAAPSQGVAHA
jgi:putative ABC transport system ATP-binding protein